MMSSYSQMMNASWKICTLFRIPIRIHAYFPLYIIYRLCGGFMLSPGSPNMPLRIMALNLASVIILFITVLIHELGHSFMARRVGGHVEKILLWPFGGLAYCAFDSSPYKQLAVSLAGPLTHIPNAALWVCLWYVVVTEQCNNGFRFWQIIDPTYCLLPDIMMEGFMLQVMLAAFNLLVPMYPLDGCKILISLVVIFCKTSPPTTAKICITLSSIMCAGLLGLSVYTRNLFSGLLCLWIIYQIWTMYKSLKAGQISQHPMFQHCPGGSQNPQVMHHRDEFGGFYRVGTVDK